MTDVFDGFDWRSHLTERQLKEVDLAKLYAEKFNHGTIGHNQLVLIDLMADLLDTLNMKLEEMYGRDD